MAIALNLRVEEGQLIVDFDDQHDAVRTSLEALPPIERLQADPFIHGQTLTQALGGEVYLLKRLQDDPDNLILLNCDDTSDSFAWEFGTCSDGQFLSIKAGMLRTVERDAPPVTADGAINFVALAADPLVDEEGNPHEGYRLDLDNEMKAIRATLQNCGKSLEAKRIPPTREALNKALRKGPAVLHLTCHGNLVDTPSGKIAILSLEKKDGSHDPLTGTDLLTMPPRGLLRLVLLSACMTATGTQANLARALVSSGVPMSIGMQNPFPDPLGDELAVALYDSLFAGLTLGEALRQARQNLAQHSSSVGLPVGYVARNRWKEVLPLRDGTSFVGSLGKPGIAMLGGELQPPRPLLGRDLELHQLAKFFADGQKVITIAGTGGMGKTALAAAFAERFAWMWPQGVRAYSFANEVNFTSFIAAFLRALYGDETAIRMATLPDNEKRRAILEGASQWDGLWLFDNYESIMQGLQEGHSEAVRIHRLIGDVANGGAALLLTSREQPAGLKNERLFPEGKHLLGLRDNAGMALFFQHSVKAKEHLEAHIAFALQIQHAAEGHPLAIALLAGEYDTSPVSQADFLKNWRNELASARRDGLPEHHVTFTTAFERSYSHLSLELKLALTALSIFPFPFFAQGFAVVTGQLPDDDEALTTAKQSLNGLTRRSLLEVDGWFEDDTPATYRFQPALRQEAERRLEEAQKEGQYKGYAAYGRWLATKGYADIYKDVAVNRLVRISMDAIEGATDGLYGADRLWHIRNLAWLKQAWGEVSGAFDLLSSAVSESLPDPRSEPQTARAQSAIYYTLADVCVTLGEFDRALILYKESLRVDEQLGNDQGKAATLSAMANISLVRGDQDHALSLYQEGLKALERAKDEENKATIFSHMAQIHWARDEVDRALELYEKGLNIAEKAGDILAAASIKRWLAVIATQQGKLDDALDLLQKTLTTARQLGDMDGQASSLYQTAQIYIQRGDLKGAMKMYEEGLKLAEHMGNQRAKASILTGIGHILFQGGDKETGIARYQEGLAIFERMGMQGQSQQVRETIARLEGYANPQTNDPLAQAIAQARSAAERGDIRSAIEHQERAVDLAREAGRGRDAVVTLSVMLYNLAGYYQKAERHQEAVKALEEVVAIDEQTGHDDLESDRKTLESSRRIASISPEERAALRQQSNIEAEDREESGSFEAQLQAQLAQLPPEQRAEAEAKIRQAYEEFQRMSPEQQAAVIDQSRRAQTDKAAIQAQNAAMAYYRKQAPKKDIVDFIRNMAKQAAEGEQAGSPWLEVAALCNCLLALINDEEIPPVPSKYVTHFSAVQQEMKS